MHSIVKFCSYRIRTVQAFSYHTNHSLPPEIQVSTLASGHGSFIRPCTRASRAQGIRLFQHPHSVIPVIQLIILHAKRNLLPRGNDASAPLHHAATVRSRT